MSLLRFPRLLLPLTLALVACRESPAPRDAGAVVGPAREGEGAPAPMLPGRGVIEGRVRLAGSPLVPALPTSASVLDTCGSEVADPSVRRAEDGGLAEVVVFLDVPTGPLLPGEEAPILDQQGCRYLPAVLGARAGSTLRVRNSDPLVHNVRSVSGGRSLFNVAMPLEGMILERPLPAGPGVVAVACDLHPWMRATVRTFAHGWFTSTDAEGRFRLEGLPEGARTVRFWHPRLPEQQHRVELTPDVPQRVEVSWDAGQLRPLEAAGGAGR